MRRALHPHTSPPSTAKGDPNVAFKTLAEQISGRCVYYNGLSGPGMKDDSSRRCDAGVVYLTVKDETRPRDNFQQWPCFRSGEPITTCLKRHFPTPEEVAAEVAEHDARWERLKLGIGVASENAKLRGLKKGSGGVGEVPCPVCKSGTLHYSVAGYNGHMHGHCTTKDCLSWMQ